MHGGHDAYVLHFRGSRWVQAATFRAWAAPSGIAAISGRAAWIWGPGYLYLVSGGVMRRLHPPALAGIAVGAIASDGTTDTWVEGRIGDGLAVAHWDGTSWRQTPLPAGLSSPYQPTLSTDGPFSAWLVVLRGGEPPWQWVLHWDGRAWSRAYAPPARLYGGRYDESGPDALAVAGSAGRAWVVYTEERVPEGVIAGGGSPSTAPTRMYSVYFNGSNWTTVRVPGPLLRLSEVAMAGPDAWAIDSQGPAILCAPLGRPWRRLPEPWLRHWTCGDVSGRLDISPPYVVQTREDGMGHCPDVHGYVWNGRRWLAVRPA